jgi:hypothetical protein
LDPSSGEEHILSERVDQLTGNATKEDAIGSINNTLKYHFLANMALDVFLSPLYDGEPGVPSLMFIQDGVNVYGYETNTGLKILVGTNGEIDQSYDVIFKKLHKLYLGMVVNPFNNGEINEDKLSKRVTQVISEWKGI